MFNHIEVNYRPDEVLVYLRKSRSDDPALTVEEVLLKHETILDDWSVKHMGGCVPEENKYREVLSGETIADRPEVRKLLERIESPRIKAVLVVEVQRISRGDLEDAGRLIKLFRYTGTVVITPQFTYDLQNEYDRDFFERELKRGNEFLEYQKKIMSRGRLLSVQQGNYVGSVAPYGYEKCFVLDGKRKCPTLRIVEEEAEMVRLAFDLYVNQDMGATLIAQRLNSLGSKPRKGDHWTSSGVIGMMGNISYIGKVQWNHRKEINRVEDGEVVKTRPRSEEYEIYDGRHEAIVDKALWDAAQEKKGRNPPRKANCSLRNPLAGLVYCRCGSAMRLHRYSQGCKHQWALRMACGDQSYCQTASCTLDEMMDYVKRVLQENIRDFAFQVESADNKAIIQLQSKQIELLENRMKELRRKEIRQWEKYSEEDMPRHIFETLKDKLDKEISETAIALQTARDTLPDIEVYKERIHRFQEALDALNDASVSIEQKNLLLKTCICRITYYRPKLDRLTAQQVKELGYPPNCRGWVKVPMEIDVELVV